jgi:pimeloyl-CoA synthetase
MNHHVNGAMTSLLYGKNIFCTALFQKSQIHSNGTEDFVQIKEVTVHDLIKDTYLSDKLIHF